MNQNDTPPPEMPSANDSWARPIERLAVGALPVEAVNLNVQGRRLAGLMAGFGQMWQKTYRLPLKGVAVDPSTVISEWKTHFSEFWPVGNRFFTAFTTSITPGEVAVLNLAGPYGGRLPGGAPVIATGVLVIYADDESFSFMTPEGHMFAGMITFSAVQEDATTIAQIQALIRTSDPLYEVMMRLGMSQREDAFWCATLQKVAAHFGVIGQPACHAVLVDPNLRWYEARNIWHNAALRTLFYVLLTPLRWLRDKLRI